MHDEVIAEFRPRAEAALSFVDNTVKDRPFLVGGECTIADIGCWGRMVFMAEGGFEIGHWPHLEAWAARLTAMPGFALPYALIPSKGPRVHGSAALLAEISASPGTLAR
jgi:glutathione S-transferase